MRCFRLVAVCWLLVCWLFVVVVVRCFTVGNLTEDFDLLPCLPLAIPSTYFTYSVLIRMKSKKNNFDARTILKLSR
jgi:ABC-type Fe3+ transport system permease subunit